MYILTASQAGNMFGKDSTELTPANFQKEVLDSSDPWIIAFYGIEQTWKSNYIVMYTYGLLDAHTDRVLHRFIALFVLLFLYSLLN